MALQREIWFAWCLILWLKGSLVIQLVSTLSKCDCFPSALTSKCMDISVFSIGFSIQSMDSYHSLCHEFPSPCPASS